MTNTVDVLSIIRKVQELEGKKETLVSQLVSQTVFAQKMIEKHPHQADIFNATTLEMAAAIAAVEEEIQDYYNLEVPVDEKTQKQILKVGRF